ncbi:MAG TPA: tetratricopeptide repeat protein [Candidatus Obscuribacterales bacterium]
MSSDDNSNSSAALSKALSGDVNAQVELAKSLETEGQADVALGWYKKAAIQGHSEAAILAGLLCLKSDSSVQRDAFFWFQKAATQGSAEGEYQLALLYESGMGVKMDPDESLRWLRIAANHGHAKAIAKLDNLRLFLDSVSPDNNLPRKNWTA